LTTNVVSRCAKLDGELLSDLSFGIIRKITFEGDKVLDIRLDH